VISIFRAKLARGEPIIVFGDGETTRDFVYVSDAVASLLAAAERGEAGEVYNIGTGVETSLNDVVVALSEALGVAADVSHEPERKGDIKRSVADIGKARAKLGWDPAVSFKEGVARLAP
jgi:UDP-glucose 4-epimerase